MLSSVVGKVILDELFAMGHTRDDDGLSMSGKRQVVFSGDLYLGLLTKLPNNNGAPYEDESYFAEPSDPAYFRIRIDTKSRINGKNFIGPALTDEVINVGEDKALPAYVTNQGAIMFPEASVAWDPIVGFGLFRSQYGKATLPVLWGTVTAEGGEEGVSVEQYEVPIIRAGGFKVSLV